MHIVRVDAFAVAIEREEPLAGGAGLSIRGERSNSNTSDGVRRRYNRIGQYRAVFPRCLEAMLVRIETDTGVVGYGEAQAPVLPEVPRAIVNDLFRDMLIGQDPTEIERLWQVMYDAMRERGHHTGYVLDAISAVDIALWDITGQVQDLPIAQLLGGTFRARVPIYYSGLSAPSLQEQVALAQTQRDLGFTAIKVFLGFDTTSDVETVQVLRRALGETRLMVDAHWMYDLPQAIEVAGHYEQLEVAWLESPLIPEDYAAHAELVRQTRVPIAIGEGERASYQFRNILEMQAADILQPDVGRAGGITGCSGIGRLGQSYKVPIAPHCGVGLAAYMAASLQLAASLPNLEILEYQPVMHQVANHLLREPLEVADGCLVIPERPGLGITFDESLLQRYII
jgi:galactonate dehydratase